MPKKETFVRELMKQAAAIDKNIGSVGMSTAAILIARTLIIRGYAGRVRHIHRGHGPDRDE